MPLPTQINPLKYTHSNRPNQICPIKYAHSNIPTQIRPLKYAQSNMLTQICPLIFHHIFCPQISLSHMPTHILASDIMKFKFTSDAHNHPGHCHLPLTDFFLISKEWWNVDFTAWNQTKASQGRKRKRFFVTEFLLHLKINQFSQIQS